MINECKGSRIIKIPLKKNSEEGLVLTEAKLQEIWYSIDTKVDKYWESSNSLVAKSCLTLATPWTARLLCPWDSPGKNTEVDCHFLLQGIFPTQELNPGLLHCRQILYQLSYEWSPMGKYRTPNQSHS